MSKLKFEVVARESNYKLGDLPVPAERYLRLAAMIPRIRAKSTATITKVLADAGYAPLDTMPLVIPVVGNPAECWVYPNLKPTASVVNIAESLKVLLADKAKAVRLDGNERAAKLALKRERTTFAKVLAEHTNIKKRYGTDDTVRDMAVAVGVAGQKAKIVFCKTPEDYYEMFKTRNGSCMTVGNTHFADWTKTSWVKIAEDTGHYPSAWYHYQPYSKGAFVVAGGVPIARFMVYRTDLTKDEWPLYGDVKYATGCSTKVNDILAKSGMKAGGRGTTLAPYSIPEIHHELFKGEPHCPLPFADNHTRDWAVAYDPNTKAFKFALRTEQPKWTAVNDHYHYRGYIGAKQIFNLPVEAAAVAEVAKAVVEGAVAKPANKVKKPPVPKVVVEEQVVKAAVKKKVVAKKVAAKEEVVKAPAKRRAVAKAVVEEEAPVRAVVEEEVPVKPVVGKAEVVACESVDVSNPYIVIVG